MPNTKREVMLWDPWPNPGPVAHGEPVAVPNGWTMAGVHPQNGHLILFREIEKPDCYVPVGCLGDRY